MGRLNKELVDQYCIEHYNINIKEKIAELIKPHLKKENKGKITYKQLHMVMYDISQNLHHLIDYEPLNTDEDKFYTYIEVIVSNEVRNNYYIEPPNKDKDSDKFIKYIEKAIDDYDPYAD